MLELKTKNKNHYNIYYSRFYTIKLGVDLFIVLARRPNLNGPLSKIWPRAAHDIIILILIIRNVKHVLTT